MTFVDAWHDKDNIRVVERVNGERQFQVYPADYTFYFDDPNGKHTTIYGTPVSKFSTKSKKAFQSEMRYHHGSLWESDIQPVQRCLETFYSGALAPDLNVAFFDIEVDFNPETGFADPSDPFNAITAISVYLQWTGDMITLAKPPKGMSMDIANQIASKFDNTFMFEHEGELLSTFLDLIEDVDILSGWNSEGYDIPYTVNRVMKILNKSDTRKFCLWDQYPKKRMFERYGAEQETYDLKGRIHMDYMQLYRKYTYHEMHSYSLDAIGEHEVKEKKIEYEGTLDQLYNNDFEKFIAYNRQDTLLIHKIDSKLDFISLANNIAHENTSLLPKTMGAVAVTEQGIINETHKLGFIVPNKTRHSDDETGAAGAYVAYPKKGVHKWIGSIDINSLYPSAIRALNMAPETIVGQLRQTDTFKMIEDHLDGERLIKGKKNTFATAWEGHFSSVEYRYVMDRRTDVDVTIDWDPFWLRTANCKEATFAHVQGSSTEMSGNEAWQMIFEGENPWMISANGTIFTYEKKGIIPGLLEKWYADRKVMQKTKGQFLELSHNIKLPAGFEDIMVTGGVEPMRELDFDKMYAHIKGVEVHELEKLLNRYNISIVDGYIVPDKKDIKLAISFWDKLQLVRKISLNSLYGALLNPHCRFFDHRIGQSTTLIGRTIAKHMDSFVNECITGVYDYTGDAVIYGDTDSVYFSAWPMVKEDVEAGNMTWDVNTATELYDAISDECNVSFPGFMQKAFHCPTELGKIIQGGREITASTALFITKKRYAALVVDLEGERKDVDGEAGYLKAMGLDLKRSDTPVVVQDFLKDILMDLLTDVEKDDIFEKIRDFKNWFHKLPSWEKGSPKRANNTTMYKAAIDAERSSGVKARVPGHVRASINYNLLRRINNDNYSFEITDGQKVIVCKLKDNPMGFTSVAFPTDEPRIPDWFKNLPFDDNAMEDVIVDKKIENLFGVLEWNIADFTDTRSTFNTLFSRQRSV